MKESWKKDEKLSKNFVKILKIKKNQGKCKVLYKNNPEIYRQDKHSPASVVYLYLSFRGSGEISLIKKI
ncbi:hypothetical protein [Anaerococcus obesiensis]|uniref:hypothetical protein n=1 Tax=Anaerococcus obesiensis TaxID=1287640 RepID=UPI001AD7E8DF|nr:hypothetical protein [Anaerococcus obesiensis]